VFRSPVFSLLLVVALAAGGFRIYQLSRQLSDVTSQNQDLEARYENLQNELLRAHVETQTAQMGQRSTVEALQSRIAAQRELLGNAEQRLRKVHNDGEVGKHLGGLREKLHEEGQLIADLNQQLKDIRDRRAQLLNQDKYYEQQAGVNQRQNDQDLGTQLAQQQQILQQLTNQLKHYKVNPWDSDSSDEFNALQAKVAAQKSSVQQLKEQRAASGTQWNLQRAQIHSQSQQSLGDLKISEEQLQAQLQREKAAQASLQRDIQSGVQTQSSRSALLESAQSDYESQKAKLQDLQNQLQAAQQQLQNISGK